MTSSLAYMCILLGVGLPAMGYLQGSFWGPTVMLLVLGLVWLLAYARRWVWFTSLGLFLVVTAAAFGLWRGLPPGWMVGGALSGLLAWDLTDFHRRVRQAAPDDHVLALERRHLAHMGYILIASLLLIVVVEIVHVPFTAEWAFLLVLVFTLGIVRLVSWLRQRGSSPG